MGRDDHIIKDVGIDRSGKVKSMFILCKKKLAKEPYIIPVSEVPVYSLEELCYYIYNNIYSVTEEFFDGKLAVWIREQIGSDSLAKKMKTLIERHNDLKDLVVTLLCSCDYYKEEEVVKLVEIMNRIENLPPHEKNKIKADNYLHAGKYGKSLHEYKKLLYGRMADKFTPEEYGNLLHNQAIALFHVSSFHEAARGFKEAYARNHNEQSLNQYLYTLLITDQEERFIKEGLSYDKTTEELEELKQNLIKTKEACKRDVQDGEEFVEKCKNELRVSFSGG